MTMTLLAYPFIVTALQTNVKSGLEDGHNEAQRHAADLDPASNYKCSFISHVTIRVILFCPLVSSNS